MADGRTPDQELRAFNEGRLMGLRTNRYSWWAHGRELADYILPRRYKWLIAPNQMNRGSPINQHILDSTGTLAARNLAAGIMSGTTNPTRIWFKLKIGRLDSTQTSPISLWLAECERLLMLIFQESNFYDCMAVYFFDLVVFGTAIMLMYEDYENVINCCNPCFGEYYLDIDGKYRPTIFYREFIYTVAAVVDEFGIDNVSSPIREAFNQGGASLTRELVVAHAIEPNTNSQKYGIPSHFKFRETYWEWGGSASPQGGSSSGQGFLRKRGYIENSPVIPGRWDLLGNDAYGRSPGMDALPDIKQLQLETRRKAQAIDKMVNPPMLADIQLKNQPASLIPGGVTYIAGMTQGAKPGFAPIYTVQPPVKDMMEDMNEVRDRIRKTFFNDLFQTISQYETRSNVSATEIDARRAESMLMLGPVYERIQNEGLSAAIERAFNIAVRAGIMPPPPQEIQGQGINIEYQSLLSIAQASASASGIERLFSIVGNLAGIDPAAMDNVDIDYGLDKYSAQLNNDPKLIRSPDQLQQIRQNRQKQQQAQQQAEMAEKMAAGAKTLSETDVGGGRNALQQMTGI